MPRRKRGSLADDVGFVDDDADSTEEEIEDFGLDEIKVPDSEFRQAGSGLAAES